MSEFISRLVRIVIACGVMGGVLWAGARLGHWELGGNEPRNAAVFIGTAVVGLVTYFGVAMALGAPELRDLRAAVRRRVRA